MSATRVTAGAAGGVSGEGGPTLWRRVCEVFDVHDAVFVFLSPSVLVYREEGVAAYSDELMRTIVTTNERFVLGWTGCVCVCAVGVLIG